MVKPCDQRTPQTLPLSKLFVIAKHSQPNVKSPNKHENEYSYRSDIIANLV